MEGTGGGGAVPANQFCKEGDWPILLAGHVLFQVQGDHRTFASPSNHQDGGLQELHKMCILLHMQKRSFISSSFSPTALARLGDSTAKKENKAARSEIVNFFNFFF